MGKLIENHQSNSRQAEIEGGKWTASFPSRLCVRQYNAYVKSIIPLYCFLSQIMSSQVPSIAQERLCS